MGFSLIWFNVFIWIRNIVIEIVDMWVINKNKKNILRNIYVFFSFWLLCVNKYKKKFKFRN